MRLLPAVKVELAADVDADAEVDVVEVAGDLGVSDMVVVWQAGKSNRRSDFYMGYNPVRHNKFIDNCNVCCIHSRLFLLGRTLNKTQ